MKIVLGVTGSIACYKACSLVRLMVVAGWEVRVVPTAAALQFVGEITWRTLSQNRVEQDAFAPCEDWRPRHIELASWADAVVIAPASADILAKAAHGFADNLLLETLIATTKPVIFAPSMNVHMWEAAATQANVKTLEARGAKVFSPGEGDLACGVSGSGRLPEPEVLFAKLQEILA